jgi:putative transposase
VKFRFVAKYRTTWPVRAICHALAVSPSGFYAWLGRGPSGRAQRHAVLMPAIRTAFVQSDRTYGAHKILRDVRELGHTCGRHQVARLMRAQALRARPRRRAGPVDRGVRPSTAPAANLLDRQFVATAPNQKWVADFTYIWAGEGWLYVAAVLDLFSRRVVGWAMQSAMTTQLVTDALMMAVWRRGHPQAVLHHSDRGSQYTSDDFQRLLRDLGVTCSLSRAGNVWDNSVMESFFSILKTERTARRQYRTRADARADIFITSSASTIRCGGIRRSAISVR